MKKYALYAALVAIGAMSVAVGSSLLAQDNSGGAGHASARLEGYQEVPAVSTTGHGRFSAHIDDDAQTIEWQLSYSDLEGNLVTDGAVTASHIHVGQRGVNGGVSAFFCGGGGKPACPAEGELSGVITPADVVPPVKASRQARSPSSFGPFARGRRTSTCTRRDGLAARSGDRSTEAMTTGDLSGDSCGGPTTAAPAASGVQHPADT